MDVNYNGKVEILELGWQLWEDGRLIHWICHEVPSPYYFYEYDCGLSGNIPDEIGNLDALIKLRLQNNNLSGNIPHSICNLNIIVSLFIPSFSFLKVWAIHSARTPDRNIYKNPD